MREQEKRKLIEKVSTITSDEYGETLYLRPYATDDQTIAEIARALGVKKAAVAQKLLHLALRGKQFEMAGENREKELLEWLVSNEKHKAARADVLELKIERLEEQSRDVENRLQAAADDVRLTRVLASEIYCLGVVMMSLLNQIFTKIIEYFSPVEIEKKNSTDFANRNILGLVEHSLSELENLSAHHGLDAEAVEPEILYLFTKIEKIKARLLSPNASVAE